MDYIEMLETNDPALLVHALKKRDNTIATQAARIAELEAALSEAADALDDRTAGISATGFIALQCQRVTARRKIRAALAGSGDQGGSGQ